MNALDNDAIKVFQLIEPIRDIKIGRLQRNVWSESVALLPLHVVINATVFRIQTVSLCVNPISARPLTLFISFFPTLIRTLEALLTSALSLYLIFGLNHEELPWSCDFVVFHHGPPKKMVR